MYANFFKRFLDFILSLLAIVCLSPLLLLLTVLGYFKMIGAYARVGAGSVVLRNVKESVTVMGVPAKVLKLM